MGAEMSCECDDSAALLNCGSKRRGCDPRDGLEFMLFAKGRPEGESAHRQDSDNPWMRPAYDVGAHSGGKRHRAWAWTPDAAPGGGLPAPEPSLLERASSSAGADRAASAPSSRQRGVPPRTPLGGSTINDGRHVLAPPSAYAAPPARDPAARQQSWASELSPNPFKPRVGEPLCDPLALLPCEPHKVAASPATVFSAASTPAASAQDQTPSPSVPVPTDLWGSFDSRWSAVRPADASPPVVSLYSSLDSRPPASAHAHAPQAPRHPPPREPTPQGELGHGQARFQAAQQGARALTLTPKALAGEDGRYEDRVRQAMQALALEQSQGQAYSAPGGGGIAPLVFKRSIVEMSSVKWTPERRDLFRGAIAALVDVEISAVELIKHRDKPGRRLLATDLEVTFAVTPSSHKNRNWIKFQLNTEGLEQILLEQAELRVRSDLGSGTRSPREDGCTATFRNGYSLVESYNELYEANVKHVSRTSSNHDDKAMLL